MPYDVLRSLLAKHGEMEVDVRRCIFVKLGAIALVSGENPLPGPEAAEFLKRLLAQLVGAVAAHPNVSAPTSLSENDRVTATLSTPEFLATGNTSLFHVTLPKPRLKYPEWSSTKDTEDFHVIYSGSLFAAFKEVVDYPERSGIGQEFRELVLAQIEKETSIKSPPFGPTPLHPDLYLVVQRLTDGSKKDEQPRVFREGPNLLIVLDETKISTEKLVERFFSFVSHDVLSFYRESLLSKLAGIEGRR